MVVFFELWSSQDKDSLPAFSHVGSSHAEQDAESIAATDQPEDLQLDLEF